MREKKINQRGVKHFTHVMIKKLNNFKRGKKKTKNITHCLWLFALERTHIKIHDKVKLLIPKNSIIINKVISIMLYNTHTYVHLFPLLFS